MKKSPLVIRRIQVVLRQLKSQTVYTTRKETDVEALKSGKTIDIQQRFLAYTNGMTAEIVRRRPNAKLNRHGIMKSDYEKDQLTIRIYKGWKTLMGELNTVKKMLPKDTILKNIDTDVEVKL